MLRDKPLLLPSYGGLPGCACHRLEGLGAAWGGRGAGGRLSLCVCNAPLGLGVVFIDCCLFIVVYLSLFIDFLPLPTLGLAPAQGEAG